MPVTIVDQEDKNATKFQNQRKTFRNPRSDSEKYYYALFYYKSGTTYELRLYRSADGITWTDYQTIKDFGSDIYHSASVWWHDDGSKLILYFAYTDENGNMYFRRGVIPDDATPDGFVTLGTEQANWTYDAYNGWYVPDICRDRLGYIWAIFRRKYGIYTPETGWQDLYVNSLAGGTREWTELGNYPFLNAIDYPNHYVCTATDGATEGNFGFPNMDTAGKKLKGVDFYIYSRQLGADEKITVTVYDGNGGSTSFDITPDSSFTWKTEILDAFLNDWAKVNAATFKMVYSSSGKADLIEVDCAYLKIEYEYTVTTSNYAVRCIASTAVDPDTDTWNPTWSSEYDLLVENTKKVSSSFPTVKPYNSGVTPTVLAIYTYREALVYNMEGQEILWNGTSFTEYINDTTGGGQENPTTVSLVIALNNNGYVALRRRVTLFEVAFYRARVLRWITGTGFSGAWDLWDDARTNPVISLDKTASPNELYVFGTTWTDSNIIVYQKANITDMDWGSEIEITDDSEPLAYLSSSVFDDDGKIQLIYTTQTTALVRFHEPVPFIVPKMMGEGLTWIVT